MDLDSTEEMKTIDKSDMLANLDSFSNQITETVANIQSIDVPAYYNIKNIIITGMGGSAIAGDFLKEYLRSKLSIPIYVNRRSDLPRWANKTTLVMVVSYSGNTEETLHAFKDAAQKHCMILGFSTGGKLQEYCKKRNICFYKFPNGFEPRAAIGYLFFSLLGSIQRLKLLQHHISNEITETIEVVKEFSQKYSGSIPTKNNYAKQLAQLIHESIPNIYGWDFYVPIAKRWANQLNENSKMIAHFNTLTEGNHNDIVGWAENPRIARLYTCLLFRDPTNESPILKKRFIFMKKLYADVSKQYIEIPVQGHSSLAKMISTMYLGDYVSTYLALLRGIDPTPIAIINALKDEIMRP